MVLVCDAAALLELARRSLLPQLPRLPFGVAVADVLHADPRFDLNGLDWPRLRRLGVRVQGLDADGVAVAIACQSDWPMLSSHDCFTVALALRRSWPLLTHHGCVSAAAAAHGVVVRDLRWLGRRLAESPAAAVSPHAVTEVATACPALRCHWHVDDGDDCRYRCPVCPPPVHCAGG